MSVKELLKEIKLTASQIERKCYRCAGLALQKSRAISIQQRVDQALAALKSQPDFQALNKQLLEACRELVRCMNSTNFIDADEEIQAGLRAEEQAQAAIEAAER